MRVGCSKILIKIPCFLPDSRLSRRSLGRSSTTAVAALACLLGAVLLFTLPTSAGAAVINGTLAKYEYHSVSEGFGQTVTITSKVAVLIVKYKTKSTSSGSCCGAATSGVDYTSKSGGATVLKVGTPFLIFLDTIEDNFVEHDEVYGLEVTVSNGGRVETKTLNLKILNDDRATISVSDATTLEGGELSFTATLDKALPGGASVTPAYTHGTASAGDYTANTSLISFAGTAGEKKTFKVGTIQDPDVEGNEQFKAGLTVSSNSPPWNYDGAGSAIAVNSGTGTIENDDTAPTVSISGPTDTQSGAFTVTVTFSESVTGFEKSDVAVGNGTVTGFSGSGASYSVPITPSASGKVTVDVAANVAVNSSGTGNTAASRYSVPVRLNSPPEITAPGDRTYEQGETISAFGFTVTDADDDEVTITVSGLPSGLSYTNGQVQGTVSANAAVQDYTVTISADDGTHAAVTASFTITVTAATSSPPANRPPAITAPGNRAYEQGEAISAFGFTVTDADGDEVTATVSGLPSGLSYRNGQVQGTVSASAVAQDYMVTISADDGINAAVTATFTITVTAATSTPPANRPPVITAPGNKTYEQGQTITAFGIPVTDADGDGLGISMWGLPSGLTWSWDTDSESIRVTGTVSASAAVKAYTVTVEANEVSDTDAAVKATFKITVTKPASTPPANRPPVITAPGKKTYKQGQRITAFRITVTDADKDDVTVRVSGLPSGLSYASGQVQGTVSANAAAQDYTVTISARDGVNAAVKKTFRITVTAAATAPTQNRPPVIGKPLGVYGIQYQKIPPFAIPVSDPDGDAVTVTVTGLPPGLSYTDGKVRGIPLADAPRIPALTDKVYNYTVEADDGVNPAVTGTFTYFVIYAPPRISVPGDKTYVQGETIAAFDITVDADPEYKTVEVTGLPGGLSYANGQVLGTVSADVEAKEYAVTIAADGDGVGGTVDYPPETATFTITVSAAVVVNITGPAVVQKDSFDVSITFSEDVTGFEQTDVTVGNGSVTALSGSGSGYTATITPAASGTVTVDVPADVAAGSAGTGNEAAGRFSAKVFLPRSIRFDGPTTVRTAEDPFQVKAIFSEAPESYRFEPWNCTMSYTGEGPVFDLTLTPGYTNEDDRKGSWPYPCRVKATWFGVAKGPSTQRVEYKVWVDADPPRFWYTSGITGPTAPQNGPFNVGIGVTEGHLVGFEAEDITVVNGSVTSFKANSDYGQYYTLQITPAASGIVRVHVGAAKFRDLAGWDNKASRTYSVLADLDAPTVSISGPTVAQNGPFDATITFSEDVTGFEQGDVTVGNGSVTAFSGSGDKYTATIAPAATGEVTVDVEAATAVDRVNRENTLASRYSVQADLDAPTVSISGPAEAQNGPFNATITFSEDVTGFEQGDVAVGNGSVAAFSGSGDGYTATITPAGSGTVTVDVTARAARDLAGNGNTAATRYSVQADVDLPSVSITGPAATQTGAFDVYLTFSEDVTGFEQGDMTVGNGSVAAFSGSGDSYVATITPMASGLVTVDVAANAAKDAVGNGNAAADRFTVTASLDVTNPVLEIIEPADKTYAQGETIDSFGIPVINTGVGESPGGAKRAFGNADPVNVMESDLPTVTVGGLPSGLSYTSRKVGGTVSADAEVKTYTVAINATNVNGQLDDATFRITVTASSEVTVSDASAVEGEALSFTVRLAKAVQGGLTVTPVFGVGTAGADVDFVTGATPLSFTGTAGEEQTFTVATIEDEVVEAAETFPVSLVVSGTTATVKATDTATGTITDDDADSGATVTVSDASAVEGEALSFTVRLAKAVQGGLTVTPVFDDVTATSGDDYTDNTTALSFIGAAGEERTFTVSTIEDEEEEEDETFTLSLVVSDAPSGVSSGSATGTIIEDNTDENGVGTVFVSILDPGSPVTEGSSVELPVRMTESVNGAVQVPWTTTRLAPASEISGNALQANHEHEPSSGTVTLAAGQMEATIEIVVLDDEEHEDLESFGITLGEPSVARDVSRRVSVDRRTATVTILDDDAPPVFGERDSATRSVAENTPPGTAIGAPVGATDPDNDPLVYALGGTDASAFTLDEDTGQLRTREPLDFETRDSYDGLTVTVDDGHGHTDVLSLTVNVTDVSPPDAPDAPAVASSSNDPARALDVSWRAPAANGAPVTDYDVRYREAGTSSWMDHPFVGAGAGTTVESLTAASTYEVQVRAGNVEGKGEWSDSGSGATLDRSPARVRETVTVSDAGAVEGEILTFTVSLNLPVRDGVTVTPGFSDGTATRGTDYTADVTDLRFAGTAGETHTFTVATKQDEVVENSETFTVSLGISGTSASGVTTDTATGTITDDDGGTVEGIPTVTIGGASSTDGTNDNGDTTETGNANTTGSAKAPEGDGMAFAVTLIRAVQGGLTLTPVFSDGTAKSGVDYTANTSPLRFSGKAGEIRTFTVATTEDEAVEENETFTVSLRVSDAPSGVTVGDPATGTIIDDDGGTVGGNSTVAIADANTAGDGNAPEGGVFTFTVTLNRAVQGGLTLTPVFRDGTATSGVDFTANTSPLSFSGKAGEARTFTVATTEDEDIEENETFTVSLSVSDAPSGVTVGSPVTGTILDDDGRNEPPGFDAGHATTRAVVENTPAGGAVGVPVTATDPNRDVLSYSVSGSDAFAIESDTGQITVSEEASLDYEAGPLSYAVTVTVNDGREGSDVIEVVISVTDAAEPPSAPAAPSVTGASLASVHVDWQAPDNTGPVLTNYDVEYRKQGATGWTSHAFTGTKTAAEISGLESGATYEARVRAKNAEGTSAWSAPGSGRTRINTAPVAVDDVVTVFRGRSTTSLWTDDTRGGTRNSFASPPEDFDIPEPDAGSKIAPLANSISATETDDGHTSVLANDVDAEDDWSLLTAILVEAPLHGTLTLYENGTFVYTHDGSRMAEDRFTYRVLDSRGAGSDEATVTIVITGVNLGPAVTGTIPDQVLTMGTNGRVNLTDLFTDPDGDPLTYKASSDNGVVNVSLVDGVIALTPVAVSTARVTVTARDPFGLSAKLSFAVTVENAQTNRARALELSLAAFGRTVLSQAVDAIAGRFEATSRALRATIDGSRLVLGQAFNAMDWAHVAARLFGIPLDVPASSSATGTAAQAGLSAITSNPDAIRPTLKAPSGRSILTRSSFQIAMDRPGTGWNGWTLWGRGTGSRYTGDSGSNNRMGGGVTAAYVGADYRWGNRLTLGLAASYSDGAQDFDNAGASTGEWQTRLTSLRPYLHWSPTGKLGLWGMLGFGRGDAELNSGYGGPLAGTSSSTIVTDISSRSAALGGRMDLTRVSNVDLALTADAFAVSTSSEALAGLRATAGDARRVRMMVNGSTGWSVTPDTRMDLSLALGARLDGGDVEAGLGAELAGALSITNRRVGLDVEIRSRWLAAHQDRHFRERGLSLALGLDPGSDNRGLTLSLSPAWGENAGSGVEALWKGERTMAYRSAAAGREGEALDWRPSRTRAALGYGLRTQRGRGGMEPFVELDVKDMGLHRLGGGLRLNVAGGPDGSQGFLARSLRLELLGEYRLSGRSAAIGESATTGGGGYYRFGLSLFRDF